MYKTQRHESSAVRTPPRRTPIAPPAPPTALHSPTARASCAPEKVVMMIVKVAGERAAATMPCMAVARVRHPADALNGTCGSEPSCRLSEAAHEAGGVEKEQPDQKDPSAPEGVCGPPTEK